MNRIIKNSFLSMLISILILTFSNTLVMATIEMPTVYSEAAILMDGITGKTLYSKNEHVRYEPASTTKVMTALVVLEKTNLSDKVTIGEKPPMVDGSAIGIQKGEVYTVEELLIALLLDSANDAAEALAEYVGGSNEGFAVFMNAKAKEIGATNTTFKNPSGLHEEGHLTTAYDLALMMKEANNNPEFVRISQIYSYKFVNQPFSDGTEKWAVNRNQLFNEYTNYLYEYANSGKNGYTPEANHTYTASAVKDGQVLIAAFLNATDKDNFYLNIGPLFDYGFENFETVKIIEKGEKVADFDIEENNKIEAVATKDIYYTRNRADEPIGDYTLNFDSFINDLSKLEKINIGDLIGSAIVSLDGSTLSSLDLESITAYEKPSISKVLLFKDINILTFVIIFILIIIVIIITSNLILYFKRKRLRKKYPRFHRKSKYK